MSLFYLLLLELYYHLMLTMLLCWQFFWKHLSDDQTEWWPIIQILTLMINLPIYQSNPISELWINCGPQISILRNWGLFGRAKYSIGRCILYGSITPSWGQQGATLGVLVFGDNSEGTEMRHLAAIDQRMNEVMYVVYMELLLLSYFQSKQ